MSRSAVQCPVRRSTHTERENHSCPRVSRFVRPSERGDQEAVRWAGVRSGPGSAPPPPPFPSRHAHGGTHLSRSSHKSSSRTSLGGSQRRAAPPSAQTWTPSSRFYLVLHLTKPRARSLCGRPRFFQDDKSNQLEQVRGNEREGERASEGKVWRKTGAFRFLITRRSSSTA